MSSSSSSSRVGWLVAIESTGPVAVEPGWNDSVRAWVGNDDLSLDEVEDERLVSIVSSHSTVITRVVVPQRADLHVAAAGGGVAVSGKIEGDATIECGAGDVVFSGSIKGERVLINARAGRIVAHRAIEAAEADLAGAAGIHVLRISALRVKAKVNGGDGDLFVGALYSADARLATAGEGGVRVTAIHGSTSVDAPTSGSRISLRGITGAVSVTSGASRPVSVHFDSARGKSVINAGGDVNVSFTTSTGAVRVSVLRAEGGVCVIGTSVPGGEFEGLVNGATPQTSTNKAIGGSGKIREGAKITGFYEEKTENSGTATDSAAEEPQAVARADGVEMEVPPRVTVTSGGRVTIEVIDYAESIRRAALEKKVAA